MLWLICLNSYMHWNHQTICTFTITEPNKPFKSSKTNKSNNVPVFFLFYIFIFLMLLCFVISHPQPSIQSQHHIHHTVSDHQWDMHWHFLTLLNKLILLLQAFWLFAFGFCLFLCNQESQVSRRLWLERPSAPGLMALDSQIIEGFCLDLSGHLGSLAKLSVKFLNGHNFFSQISKLFHTAQPGPLDSPTGPRGENIHVLAAFAAKSNCTAWVCDHVVGVVVPLDSTCVIALVITCVVVHNLSCIFVKLFLEYVIYVIIVIQRPSMGGMITSDHRHYNTKVTPHKHPPTIEIVVWWRHWDHYWSYWMHWPVFNIV